ncbi:hypothetical protein COBT_002403 [Conglomerata obtusa]
MSKPIIEDCNSSELSSSDKQPYIPTGKIEKLEVDESVYSLLEYISLDWPSQSLDTRNKKLLIATNPEKENGRIIEFNFANTSNFKSIDKYTNVSADAIRNFNRMRYHGSHVIGISDDLLVLHDKKLKMITQHKNLFGYGLATDNNIFAGCKNGQVIMFDHELTKTDLFDLHSDAVESICVCNNILYTASNDKTAKMFDTRSKTTVNLLQNDCDVNAIDFNKDNYVLTGDDKGVLRLFDIRMNKEMERIEWHKAPISFVKWKNNTEFVSCSDEQISLWDTTFEEEWDYHKYLRFVHQGQQYYKEIGFFGDVYVATSFDGLCLFSLNLSS